MLWTLVDINNNVCELIFGSNNLLNENKCDLHIKNVLNTELNPLKS